MKTIDQIGKEASESLYPTIVLMEELDSKTPKNDVRKALEETWHFELDGVSKRMKDILFDEAFSNLDKFKFNSVLSEYRYLIKLFMESRNQDNNIPPVPGMPKYSDSEWRNGSLPDDKAKFILESSYSEDVVNLSGKIRQLIFDMAVERNDGNGWPATLNVYKKMLKIALASLDEGQSSIPVDEIDRYVKIAQNWSKEKISQKIKDLNDVKNNGGNEGSQNAEIAINILKEIR